MINLSNWAARLSRVVGLILAAAVVLFCALVAIGYFTFDTDYHLARTKIQLKEIERVLLRYSFDEASAFTTLEAVFEEANKKRLINSESAATDGWNRKWHFKSTKTADCVELVVISLGANGILENDKGDE